MFLLCIFYQFKCRFYRAISQYSMQTCKQCLMMEKVEIETLVQKCFTDWQFCLVFESPLCFSSNGQWKDINRKKI